MKAHLAGAVLGLILLAGGGAQGLGGIHVIGAGTGTFSSSGGPACPNVPFEITITYLPGDAAVLQVLYVDPTCRYIFGGAVYTGSLAVPSLALNFSCRGNEASGLTCTSSDGNSEARVGPYAGPGQAVSFTRTMFTLGESFAGSFLAI